MKNCKTTVIPPNKHQTVTGIVVNKKLDITKDYKKKIRQEMYFIKKFRLDEHLNKMGISDKAECVFLLKGKIALVLQTIPNDVEFMEYKKALESIHT